MISRFAACAALIMALILLTGCIGAGIPMGDMSRGEAACHVKEMEMDVKSTPDRLWILKGAKQSELARAREKFDILPGEAATLCADHLKNRPHNKPLRKRSDKHTI